MRRLRIGGKTLRVRDEPEPAPDAQRAPVPLLCLHGAGMSSVVWMDTVRRLAPGRRVVAPDLPGHGQSQGGSLGPGVASDLAAYCEAVFAVSTQLALGRVVLVGHSMGAAVALLYALKWPERVAGLVLVNSAAALPVTPELMEALARELPAADTDEPPWVDRLPAALGGLFFSPATSRDVRERWQAVLLAATRSTVLGDFQACGGFDIRARLGELKLPTLIIGGQDDLLVSPRALMATAAQISGAQVQLVPDTGHMTHLEQPEKFFARLGEFLAGVA